MLGYENKMYYNENNDKYPIVTYATLTCPIKLFTHMRSHVDMWT
jgi:hypothetical protein